MWLVNYYNLAPARRSCSTNGMLPIAVAVPNIVRWPKNPLQRKFKSSVSHAISNYSSLKWGKIFNVALWLQKSKFCCQITNTPFAIWQNSKSKISRKNMKEQRSYKHLFGSKQLWDTLYNLLISFIYRCYRISVCILWKPTYIMYVQILCPQNRAKILLP